MSTYQQPIANVQYDDMLGTCAADFSETSAAFLKSIGFNRQGRYVLHLRCFSTYTSDFSVSIHYLKVNSYDEAKEALSQGKEVFEESIDVSHADFFKHFKRFSLVLGRKSSLLS